MLVRNEPRRARNGHSQCLALIEIVFVAQIEPIYDNLDAALQGCLLFIYSR